MSQMTNEEYVQEHGYRCPFCRSERVEGWSIEIDCGHALQEMGCLDCDAEWVDTYTLTGYGQFRISGGAADE